MKRYSRFDSNSPLRQRRGSPPMRRDFDDYDRHYEKSMPPVRTIF